MKTHCERMGREPDFQVSYRFLAPAEGGRQSPPRQHVRWDFLYAGDDPQANGVFMIWPEFLTSGGEILAEGEVPMNGLANMFIVNLDLEPLHRARIAVGTKGHFMEGCKRVAECEVSALGSLAKNHAP